jgi:FkbM family methyltransferase
VDLPEPRDIPPANQIATEIGTRILKKIAQVLKNQLSPHSRARIREVLTALRFYPPKGSDELQLETCRDKLLQVGGKIDRQHIEVEGIRLNNCYKHFALVAAENLYHQYYKVSLTGRWIAVDIGANAGVSSLFLAQNENIHRIYAFEPLLPIFDMLKGNLQLNPLLAGKIELSSCGLGAKDESVTVQYCADEAMSVSSKGTYNRFFKSVDSVETITIKDSAVELSRIFSANPAERILLKIDCEGAEFEIIPHLASHNLLERVDAIMMEFHDRHPEELIEVLKANGFISFTEWARRDLNIGMIKAVRPCM